MAHDAPSSDAYQPSPIQDRSFRATSRLIQKLIIPKSPVTAPQTKNPLLGLALSTPQYPTEALDFKSHASDPGLEQRH
ncbi:hypothetical protein ACJZ2D_006138 [Fusarium nematophilum]